MKFKQQEHDERRYVSCPIGIYPTCQHDEKRRGFHQNPPQSVVERDSPFLRVHNAIAGVYEIE